MRIRNIKPEFWRSDDIKRLPREFRLLFIGLWSYVDDNGVGIDDYRQVAADLFALEDDQAEVREYVQAGLRRLAGDALVSRYVLLGKSYLFINSWVKHQKVHNANKARYPLPNGVVEHPASDYVGPTETLGRPSGESTETLGPGGNGHATEDTKTGTDSSTGSPQALGGNASTSGYVDPPETLGTGSGGQGVRGSEGQREKITSAEPPRDDVNQLCLRLQERVVDNGVKKPTITEKWRTEARLLLDKDERPLDVALRLIDWATSNEFWRPNILSMPTFRAKYDQLLLQARREQQQRPPDQRPSTTDQRVAQAQALKALYPDQSNILQLPGAAS